MKQVILIVSLALLTGCAYLFLFPSCTTEDFYEYLSCTQPRYIGAEKPTEERLREIADLLDSYCKEDADELLPILDNAIIDVIPAAQATMRGEGKWARRYEFEGRPGPLLKGDLFRAVLDAYLIFLEEYQRHAPGRDFCVDIIEDVDERIVTLLIYRPEHP